MDMNGTWKLMTADNIPEICDVLDVKAEFKEKAIQLMSPGSGVKQSIKVDGNNVSITYHIPGKTIEANTTLGEPVNMPFFDGRIMQCVFTIDGDKLVETESGAFDAVNIRYRQGEQLIIKTTAKNVTSTRVYEKA